MPIAGFIGHFEIFKIASNMVSQTMLCTANN